MDFIKMRRITFLLLIWLLAACQSPAPAPAPLKGSLSIFAASSLTEAFTEIGNAFQASNPGVEFVFNFAGSQQLGQQLAQGAPADVFASANESQMDAAVEAGRVSQGSSQIFATNKLVVIFPKENPAGLTRLNDLGKPGIKLVLAAKEVPVGGYSLQFLEKASQSADFGGDFKDKVISNVVSNEENVRAVYSKVALGEADAGIVYTTDIPKNNPDGVGVLEIPPDLNIIARYPIAAISDSSNLSLAESFVDFVLSAKGQAILAAYGFTPPN
jgi:molybdate transport system substrate-binding protein